MLIAFCVCIMLQFVWFSDCEFEGKIIRGEYANITDFPHSAFLAVVCIADDETNTENSWMCGSSVLNQQLLLTAAHCLADCSSRSWMLASVGHEHMLKGNKHRVYSYLVHENYVRGIMNNDIGLVRLKMPLTFTSTVRRVIIVPKPPYDEKCQVAGWGRTSFKKGSSSPELKYCDQYILDKKKCIDLLDPVPIGTICGWSNNLKEKVYRGDSGSALVVRGFIQIGIVSFGMIYNRSICMYTDIGYFYNWIEESSELILCDQYLKNVYLS